MGDMATRAQTTAADVTAPNEELTDVNRRAAEAGAAATTRDGRNRAGTPTDPPADPAA